MSTPNAPRTAGDRDWRAAVASPLQAALLRKQRDGAAGQTHWRGLAAGEGWRVADILCTSGPGDHAFEERHGGVAIAVVMSGAFSYCGSRGRALMTPGALLLGNAEACFSCGHEHGEGDRCLSIYFEPATFERIAVDVGTRKSQFALNRIPACKATSLAITRALQLAEGGGDPAEVVYSLGALALTLNHSTRPPKLTARDERRVIDVVRWIERSSAELHTLDGLARRAHLSPYHFLRVFKNVVGVSPHQFVLRMRLRAAAQQLMATRDAITEVAAASGFSDLAHFNRSFRAEFGASPTAFRAASR